MDRYEKAKCVEVLIMINAPNYENIDKDTFDCPYYHENLEEGIKLFRWGTAENGIYLEFYSDNSYGYTKTKKGKIVESIDFHSVYCKPS